MVTGKLMMALGGWFPAVGRDICFVPDGFSRAAQEHGQQSGAKKSLPKLFNEIDWDYKACFRRASA
jgi:hypothetical protein